MNIIEQEDLVKGLPDEALFQQAQNPSSQVPQFLVVSEIQRRTDMRKRFEAAEAQPQSTVTEQIVMEGLGAAAPAPQGSMPPAAMPAPPSSPVPPEGSSPSMGLGMAAGGIVGMSNGGAAFGPEYHALQEQRRELAPYMNPFSGSYSPAVSSAAQTMVGQSQEAYRGAVGKEARIRKEEERLREIEAIERFGGVVPEELKETYLLEGDIEIEYGEGTPLPEELLRPLDNVGNLDDVGNIADIVAGMTFDGASQTDNGEEIGTPYKGIASGGGEGREIIGETDLEALTRSLEGTIPTDFKVETGVDGVETRTSPSFTASNLDQTDLLGEMEASRTGLMDRLGTRRTQSQELIEQIRDEGRRDAFSAAMMQLGAGVAGGDLSGGLQRAGDIATSTNALARDAARAEQRGMRDYEEAALTQSDLMGLEAEKFKYAEAKERQLTTQEQARWEAEHGIRELSLQLESQFKNAGLEAQYATLKSDQILKIAEIAAKAQSEVATTRREAMRLFSSYMGDIQNIAEDMPAMTSEENKMTLIRGMQSEILQALEVELGSDFLKAFTEEAEAEAAGGADGEITAEEFVMGTP